MLDREERRFEVMNKRVIVFRLDIKGFMSSTDIQTDV